MAFDSKKFMAAQFEPRTGQIEVPGLADWFDKSEPPVWTVRGQTANEVAMALEAGSKHKNIDAIIKAITANEDQVNELKKAIGVNKDTPGEIVKRLEQLVQCSIEPEITLDVAVKMGETRPIEFYQLTNEILRLTAMGMDIKKPKASGKTAKSEA
ncbi:MAG: hypothetical protein WC856_13645 [Methylococcaceae bacterium]|jgi:hypothetical protein